MNDAARVQVDERARNLGRDVERSLHLHLAVALDRAERFALRQLHDQVHPALLLGREHADDVGVVELLTDLLLALEALIERDVGLVLEVRHLQRHGLSRRPIESP